MGVLDEPVLALNNKWHYASLFTVRVAIVNVMRDMASCLYVEGDAYTTHTYESWIDLAHQNARWIKSGSRDIPAPEVIVLKAYGSTPPKKIALNKINLARRDEHTCQYCGKGIGLQQVTIDHVMPRSRGGPLTWENCVAACATCNSRKADKTPKEARMPLRKQPHAPTFNSDLVRIPHGTIRPAWLPFLHKRTVGA